MSVDQDCSSEMAAMLGSSLALSISDIPFEGQSLVRQLAVLMANSLLTQQ